jgi:hypothetical protein
MTLHAASASACTFCGSLWPRLYILPSRTVQQRCHNGPICYFCFVKMAGVKPTRKHLATRSIALEPATTD